MPIELPPDDFCLFCERMDGRRGDWAPIETSPLSVAFINPRQFEVGQSLVVPRRHAPTFLDLTEEEIDDLMRMVQRVARAMVAAYDPDGLTIYQNNGVASFQEVPHTHMHVVPRRSGSGWGEGPPHLAALDRGVRDARFARNAAPLRDMQRMAEEIRQHL